MTSPDQARAKRDKIRVQLLKLLDRERPTPALADSLMRSLVQAGLNPSDALLAQELAYFEDKGLAIALRQGSTLLGWRLLPLGVDILEGHAQRIPGIPIDMPLVPPETAGYRREVRGRLLMALYYARPHGTSARTLWLALDDSDLPVSDNELAKEAAYLADKALITLDGDLALGIWSASLTAAGRDMMEYTVPAPPSIKLVEKYWEG